MLTHGKPVGARADGGGPTEFSATGQMQIGVVAELTELSIRTLRHYDEVGLVTPSARSSGGFRLYTFDDVERLRTIRRMKPLGFTLDEMRDLLDSLDILADASAAAERRRAAAAFVGHCHQRAEEACNTIKTQLAYAQEFAALLATKV